jgi:hypothetical protein
VSLTTVTTARAALAKVLGVGYSKGHLDFGDQSEGSLAMEDVDMDASGRAQYKFTLHGLGSTLARIDGQFPLSTWTSTLGPLLTGKVARAAGIDAEGDVADHGDGADEAASGAKANDGAFVFGSGHKRGARLYSFSNVAVAESPEDVLAELQKSSGFNSGGDYLLSIEVQLHSKTLITEELYASEEDEQGRVLPELAGALGVGYRAGGKLHGDSAVGVLSKMRLKFLGSHKATTHLNLVASGGVVVSILDKFPVMSWDSLLASRLKKEYAAKAADFHFTGLKVVPKPDGYNDRSGLSGMAADGKAGKQQGRCAGGWAGGRAGGGREDVRVGGRVGGSVGGGGREGGRADMRRSLPYGFLPACACLAFRGRAQLCQYYRNPL